MGLPALDAIARLTRGTPAQAGMTLSLFLLGLAVGPLAYGPLSDRWGRRPPLIAGCVLFILGAGFAALAGSMRALLFWRFVQGLGAGASTVLALAIIRDLFEGAAARGRLAQASLVRMASPMLAPSLGSLILPVAGPRGIYATMALAGLVMLLVVVFVLPETAPRFSGRILHPTRLLPSYRRVLCNRQCVGYSLINAMSFGCQFAFVTGSSLVIMGVLGQTPAVYSLLFASAAVGVMGGFFANARLAARGAGRRRPLAAGLFLAAASAALAVAAALVGHGAVWLLMPLFVANSLSFGLITPNASQGALEPLPEIAGVAAAVLSVLMMTTGAATGFLVAVLDDGHTALATTGVMLGSALVALLSYLVLVLPAERASKLV